MKMRRVDVSAEYCEELCFRLLEFAKKPTSWTFPEFFADQDIGYSYFKWIAHYHPEVHHAFEVAKSILCKRWINFAFKDKESKNLAPHQAKLLLRYINLYDLHGRDVKDTEREALKEIETIADMRYQAECYAGAKLDGIHQQNYDQNISKRRSSEKA